MGFVVVGMCSLGSAPCAHSELVPLAAETHGRAAKALLPIQLCAFISLDVLGIPAGRSFGKYFSPSFKYAVTFTCSFDL